MGPKIIIGENSVATMALIGLEMHETKNCIKYKRNAE